YCGGVDQVGKARSLLGQAVDYTDSGEEFVAVNDVVSIASYDQPGFYAPSGAYFITFTITTGDKSIRSISLETLNLSREYNEDIYNRLYPSPTEDTYEQTWQIKWGNPPLMSFVVSGDSGDITFYPDNNFKSDELNGLGIQFTFTVTGEHADSNRV